MKVNFGFFPPSPFFLPLDKWPQKWCGCSSEEVQKDPLSCRKKFIRTLVVFIFSSHPFLNSVSVYISKLHINTVIKIHKFLGYVITSLETTVLKTP